MRARVEKTGPENYRVVIDGTRKDFDTLYNALDTIEIPRLTDEEHTAFATVCVVLPRLNISPTLEDRVLEYLKKQPPAAWSTLEAIDNASNVHDLSYMRSFLQTLQEKGAIYHTF